MNIVIVGAGRFGKFWGAIIRYYTDHLYSFYDPDRDFKDKKVFQKADLVIFCVPIREMQKSISECTNWINSTTEVSHVGSVQSWPNSLLDQYFPYNPRSACHPLFGPQSFPLEFPVKNKEFFKGGKIVITSHMTGETSRLIELIDILVKWGLSTIYLGAEEHDKEIASQAVLHFLGRGAEHLREKINCPTKSFHDFQEVLRVVNSNSRELFEDMFKFNPYAKEARKRVLDQLVILDKELEELEK